MKALLLALLLAAASFAAPITAEIPAGIDLLAIEGTFHGFNFPDEYFGTGLKPANFTLDPAALGLPFPTTLEWESFRAWNEPLVPIQLVGETPDDTRLANALFMHSAFTLSTEAFTEVPFTLLTLVLSGNVTVSDRDYDVFAIARPTTADFRLRLMEDGTGFGFTPMHVTLDMLFVPQGGGVPYFATISDNLVDARGEFQAIPEPATWTLMGAGALLLLLARRRRAA